LRGPTSKGREGKGGLRRGEGEGAEGRAGEWRGKDPWYLLTPPDMKS